MWYFMQKMEVFAVADLLLLINLDIPASRSVARKLRGEGFFCLVMPAGSRPEDFPEEGVKGLVFCGGSTGHPIRIPCLEACLQLNLPILALGDAALTLCQYYGGSLTEPEDKAASVAVRFTGTALSREGLGESGRYLAHPCYMVPSPRMEPIATADGGVLGFRVPEGNVYAMAFQVENNDPDGLQLLVSYGQNVCGCDAWWSQRAFIDTAVREIQEAADGGDGFCAISGGVDSATCAALGKLALGTRMHCLFVDTGLMREGEPDNVMENLAGIAGLDIQRVDAREEFIQALEGVADPEQKERIIYSRLRAHLRHAVSLLPDVRVILQSTNYSDTFGRRVELNPELPSAGIRMLTPLRYLFKDEIRRVAETLGLPEAVCRRQPFPSSGLALRIVPLVTGERLAQLGTADRILREEIEEGGYNKRLWQYYATLFEDPIPGDEGLVVVIRAVQTAQGGAVAARLPSDLAERVTERILAGIPQVRRVFYDLTPSRSYGRVEWS